MPSPRDLVDLYRDFDPAAPVSQATLGQFVARGGESAKTIFEDLALGLDPLGKWVITGSVGCGKSSELVELAWLLRERFAVVPVDLSNSVARVDLLQPAEILFLIGAATMKSARELWGHEIDQALKNQLLSAFSGLVEDSELDLTQAFEGAALFLGDLTFPGAGKLASGVAKSISQHARHRPSPLGGKTRSVADGSPDLRKLIEALDLILREVRSNYRSPVVLVDGLDKLLNLDSIRNLFVTTAVLRQPESVIVYTGPITLMLAPEWKAAGDHFRRIRLSNLVVHAPKLATIELATKRIASDRSLLRELVRLRVTGRDHELEQVFDAGALDDLIDASGGLIRDLVHLVNRSIRSALRRNSPIIDALDTASARSELRKDMEVSLNTRLREQLDHVDRLGEPSGSVDAQSLLLWGYVLPYSNGRVWFESHPLLGSSRGDRVDTDS